MKPPPGADLLRKTTTKADRAPGDGARCVRTEHRSIFDAPFDGARRAPPGESAETQDGEEQPTHLMHQANCVSKNAKGFASDLFRAYPWCNLYEQRFPRRSEPGTVVLQEPPPAAPSEGAHRPRQPTVVHLLGQWAIGRPGALNARYARTDEERAMVETKAQRAEWFRHGLEALDALGVPTLVAVPERIGCALGGGDWEAYRAMLDAASTRFVVYTLRPSF